ncbi:unnamed protein product, partial [Polarella glacialis]
DGQAGDQREAQSSAHLQAAATPGDPEAALTAFEDFHATTKPLFHIGPEKGRHLDAAVSARAPMRVLEVGAYMGYSAIRMGRLLCKEARLYSVEACFDNARLAEQNVAHAGLSDIVTVLHGTVAGLQSELQKLAPFDFVLLDHKKTLYLEELDRLEKWAIVQPGTVIAADNIGGCNRDDCSRLRCGCGYAKHMRTSGRYQSSNFWGTRDGLEISHAGPIDDSCQSRVPARPNHSKTSPVRAPTIRGPSSKPPPASKAKLSGQHLLYLRELGLPLISDPGIAILRRSGEVGRTHLLEDQSTASPDSSVSSRTDLGAGAGQAAVEKTRCELVTPANNNNNNNNNDNNNNNKEAKQGPSVPENEAAVAAAEQVFGVLADAMRGNCKAMLPTREEVAAVPGAFIVRGAFSADEAALMGKAVHLAHGGRPPRDASETRRDSQHHRAVHVPQAALAVLCERLRSLLPATAGPSCAAKLEVPGREISTFLRCYRYLPGDMSRPHWDRSFCLCEHTPNVLSSFSAFSVLLYVSDEFEGGETTFFESDPDIPVSNKGLTPHCDRSSLVVATQVKPRAGDALVFPHGLHPGCHPSPLHEGSLVGRGEKLLVRTDVMFAAHPPRSKQVTLRFMKVLSWHRR